MATLQEDLVQPTRCYGRMARQKFKVHGATIYSEKRCSANSVKGRLLCVRCLGRPPGPTRHGNQEGYQVDQGMVNSEYPSWSAIFGSSRYLALIEEFGEPDVDILKTLIVHQTEARHGCNWMNTEIKELYEVFREKFGESKSVPTIQNSEVSASLLQKMPRGRKKTLDEEPLAALAAASATSVSEKTSHGIKDFIRPVQYIARTREPYLVQEIVYISRDKLQEMLAADGVHFELTK